MSQPYLPARRSRTSARTRSVPWRRSTKGETTARRKSANPAARGFSCGSGVRELRRKSDRGKPEEQTEQQPEIRVQQEVLVAHQSSVCSRDEQEEGVPKNDESKREPGRAFQLLYDLPC